MADETQATTTEQGNTETTTAQATTTEQATTRAHWTDSLPEDMRGNEALKGFADVSELSKAHLEMMGKIPKAPESVEGYTFTIPDGLQIDEGFVGALKQGALEDGIPAEVFGKMAERYIAFQQKAEAEGKAEVARDWEAKIVEWGNRADEMINYAIKGAEIVGDKEFGAMLIQGIKEKWLMPQWLSGFIRVGKAISEDTFHFDDAGGGNQSKVKRDQHGRAMLDFGEGS